MYRSLPLTSLCRRSLQTLSRRGLASGSSSSKDGDGKDGSEVSSLPSVTEKKDELAEKPEPPPLPGFRNDKAVMGPDGKQQLPARILFKKPYESTYVVRLLFPDTDTDTNIEPLLCSRRTVLSRIRLIVRLITSD